MGEGLRAEYLSCYGFPHETSPDIDRVAAEGVRFVNAYTTMPICAPARCSFFTGRFPNAHGIRDNWTRYPTPNKVRFRQDLVQVLRAAGYHTALIGKDGRRYHTDFDYSGGDGSRYTGSYTGDAHCEGVKHLSTVRRGHEQVDAQFSTWKRAVGVSVDPAPFPLESQWTHRLVTEAIKYLEFQGTVHGTGTSGSPFFLYLPFYAPTQYGSQVPAPYFDMFPPSQVPERIGPEYLEAKGHPWDFLLRMTRHANPDDPRREKIWRRARSNYLGMIRLLSDEVGRLLRYLESADLAARTHVIVCSDHGDFAEDFAYGLHESRMRIPLIWRGPRIASGRAVDDAFVSIVDLMPTLCRVLNVDAPLGVQGRSLVPLLRHGPYEARAFQSVIAGLGIGGARVAPRDVDALFGADLAAMPAGHNIVFEGGNVKMLRKGRWKLVIDWERPGELYDLDRDPIEQVNLFEEPRHRAVREELLRELLRWLIRTEDPLPQGRFTLHGPLWLESQRDGDGAATP
jgi:arylsulfatase A-like enzyme